MQNLTPERNTDQMKRKGRGRKGRGRKGRERKKRNHQKIQKRGVGSPKYIDCFPYFSLQKKERHKEKQENPYYKALPQPPALVPILPNLPLMSSNGLPPPQEKQKTHLSLPWVGNIQLMTNTKNGGVLFGKIAKSSPFSRLSSSMVPGWWSSPCCASPPRPPVSSG